MDDSIVIILVVLLVCCFCCMFSSSTATLVVQQQKASTTNDDDVGSDGNAKPLPDWILKQIDPGNTACQELVDKYGIYPGYSRYYITSGTNQTKYILNACESQILWPKQSTPVSNLYTIRSRNSAPGFPYVGLDSTLNVIANTDGKVFANVQPGPQLCVYKDGTKSYCIAGTPMEGTFSMGFDKYANFCMVDSSNSSNIAWCALPRIDDSSIPTTSYSDAAAFIHSKTQLFNGGGYKEVDSSNRVAVLQSDGKICIYDSLTSPPVWCNK